MDFVSAPVNFTSSWIALTRNTEALRSAMASTFPTSRSPWRIGQGEVAPAALGGGLVHLERVLEVEQLLGARPVVDEAVERRQQRRPPFEIPAERGGVDAPFALRALDHGRLAGLAHVDRLDRHGGRLLPGDPERGEPPLVPDPARLVDGRDDDVGRVHPRGDVPQPLPSDTSGDRDLAAHHQELEHLGDVAVVRPAGRGPRHDARVRDVA